MYSCVEGSQGKGTEDSYTELPTTQTCTTYTHIHTLTTVCEWESRAHVGTLVLELPHVTGTVTITA